jgi:nicotinamidase-related amidase
MRPRVPLKNLAGPTPPTRLDDGCAALVVVDVHRFTVARGFGFDRMAAERGIARELDEYFDQVEQALPNIRRLVEGCRRRSLPVVFTRLAAPSEQSVVPQARVTGFWSVIGSPDAAFLPDIAPGPGDLVVDRTTVGAFAGTTLHGALRSRGIASVILCGVVANESVQQTAREAVDLGYHVVVASNACAAETWAHHGFVMATIVGGTIRTRTADGVLEMLEAGRG